jgi:flagellar biosynthesis protein FlhF
MEILVGVPDEPEPTEPKSSSEERDTDFFPANLVSVSANRWRSVGWLEAMGLLPRHAERLQSRLFQLHGTEPPPSLESEWKFVNAALAEFWRTPLSPETTSSKQPHVFIGPPGSGKSTALCKWLTLAVLTEERLAHVWRLDAATANTAEFLSIHCEMLGTPVDRFWSPPRAQADLLFVDLPGVEAEDTQALNALREQLKTLPSPRVHLVLNAAYETSALIAQWRAFLPLSPEDVIFTHLDEVTQRVKLWNFVFDTGRGIRFLSAGQKIPGEFRFATPELLFPSENRR